MSHQNIPPRPCVVGTRAVLFCSSARTARWLRRINRSNTSHAWRSTAKPGSAKPARVDGRRLFTRRRDA